MNLNLKAKLTCLLIWCVLPLFAQQGFKYKAALQTINADGFYRVELQPGLIAQCQLSLADIRIKDENGQTVAYLLGSALPVKEQQKYHKFPKVENTSTTDSLSSFVAENKEKLNINQLWIKLRNTAVSRRLSVLGSDDLKHWFAIKEDIELQANTEGKTGTFDELLTLPASTYRYIKIQVNGRTLTPVNILQAGVYLRQQAKLQYVPIPIASLNTQNKADTTLITITFKYAYRVNKLHLEFSDAEYYQRRLKIYQLEGDRREWLQDTQLSSGGSGDMYLSAKAHKIQLVIYNNDNPPLKLKVLQVGQAEQALVAYLKKQHQYQLWVGNTKISAPVYDLLFFADSINRALPVVKHAAMVSVSNTQPKANNNQLPGWVLWIAGGIGLIALLILTLKMTKEVGKNNS